jgi:hypothetical protein
MNNLNTKDITNISEITRKILKYNKPFNKRENEEVFKKLKPSTIDKLLFIQKPGKKEKKGKELQINKSKPTITNIQDMVFIEDIVLVEKIITYKRYEIDNKIALLQTLVNSYENTCYNICLTNFKIQNFDVLKAIPNSIFIDSNIDKSELQKVLDTQTQIKAELFSYINEYLSNDMDNNKDKNVLRILIEKYSFLKNELERIKSNYIAV